MGGCSDWTLFAYELPVLPKHNRPLCLLNRERPLFHPPVKLNLSSVESSGPDGTQDCSHFIPESARHTNGVQGVQGVQDVRRVALPTSTSETF